MLPWVHTHLHHNALLHAFLHKPRTLPPHQALQHYSMRPRHNNSTPLYKHTHTYTIVATANLSKATVTSNMFVCLSVTRNNSTQCTSIVTSKPKHTVMGINCSQHNVYMTFICMILQIWHFVPQTFIHHKFHSLWTLMVMKIVANRHSVDTL